MSDPLYGCRVAALPSTSHPATLIYRTKSAPPGRPASEAPTAPFHPRALGTRPKPDTALRTAQAGGDGTNKVPDSDLNTLFAGTYDRLPCVSPISGRNVRSSRWSRRKATRSIPPDLAAPTGGHRHGDWGKVRPHPESSRRAGSCKDPGGRAARRGSGNHSEERNCR